MPTILLLEDNAFNLSIFRTVLQGAGYHVLAAQSGAEARRVASEHPGTIDLLIADVILQGERGTDIALQMRAAQPDLRCLVISGYTDDELRDRGLLNTAAQPRNRTYFLQKPFLPNVLLQRVAEALA